MNMGILFHAGNIACQAPMIKYHWKNQETYKQKTVTHPFSLVLLFPDLFFMMPRMIKHHYGEYIPMSLFENFRVLSPL